MEYLDLNLRQINVPGFNEVCDREFENWMNKLLKSDISEASKEQFSMSQFVGDISKVVNGSLRSWKLMSNKHGSMRLADFLERHNLPEIAEYVKKCTIQDGDCAHTLVENHPLMPSKPNPCAEEESRQARNLHNFKDIVKNFIAMNSFPIIVILLLTLPTGFVTAFMAGYHMAQSSTAPLALLTLPNYEFFTTLPIPSSSPATERGYPIVSSSYPCIIKGILSYGGVHPDVNPKHSHTLDFSQDTANFCAQTDILAIVRMDDAKHSKHPSIVFQCPENVVGLEVSGQIQWKFLLDLVRKFCNLRKISFVGSDVCQSSTEDIVDGALAYPITHLSFKAFTACSNLFDKVTKYFMSHVLKVITFSCVQFENSGIQSLQNLIDTFPTVSTVQCSNSNNCIGFKAKIPKHTMLRMKYEKC